MLTCRPEMDKTEEGPAARAPLPFKIFIPPCVDSQPKQIAGLHIANR